MKHLLLTLLLCVVSATSFSQTQSKTDKIKTLLESSGSGAIGVQVAQNLIDVFKQSYPQVDQQFWDEFAKEIKSEDLINLIIPIYDKYYTEEDIDQLIAFYNTPIGQKMVKTLPMITQESMTAGQAWGKSIAEKVIKQLQQKGYLKSK